jgi:hypothetical protein
MKRPLWQPHQQQQQQQHYGLRVNNYGGKRTNSLTIPTPTDGNARSATAAAILAEMTNGDADKTDGRTKMGVKSAFIPIRSASTMTLSGSSSGTVVASTAATNEETPIIKPGDDSVEQLIDDESEQDVLISGANTKISFDSIQKVIFATVSMALLSYCAVSPRSVPFPEYNRLFLQNLSIVAIGTIAPVVMFLSVFDGRYNNINAAVSYQRKHTIQREFLILPSNTDERCFALLRHYFPSCFQ